MVVFDKGRGVPAGEGGEDGVTIEDYKELGEKSARVNIICDFLREEGLTIGEALDVLHDVEYALVQHSPIPKCRYTCFCKEKPRVGAGLASWAARSLKERHKQGKDGHEESTAD